MDGLAAEPLGVLLRWIKEGPGGAIPIEIPGRSIGRLQAVTWEDARDRGVAERLSRWHESAFAWFPEPFSVTPDGARHWLVDRVMADPLRLLFWVHDVLGEPRGHVGLTAIAIEEGTATLGDVIPCHPRAAALVSAAVESLADWTARR